MVDIYSTLNDRQKEAVFYTDGPLLILAGAGSGKTRVLTHRIVHLVNDCGVDKSSILAITFTNKAAQEMKDRLSYLIGNIGEMCVATFHSAFIRILRQYVSYLGYDKNFVIYDDKDSLALMKQVLEALNLDTDYAGGFKSDISFAKNTGVTPGKMMRDALDVNYKLGIDEANAYAEYQKRLLECNAVDFDDMLAKSVELFENHPNVLAHYQDKFKYILVDEYQDTNPVQFRLLELLSAKHRNLCVVGDDDQSIYGFRGADIRNILDFNKLYPDAKVVRLEQNYRSTENILNAANAVVLNNKARMSKTLWTNNSSGKKLACHVFSNGDKEAEYVVSNIAMRHAHNSEPYNNSVILYRTNAQSRAFEELCVRMDVPYQIIGGVGFYERREVKDMLAYLRVVANPADNIALLRIINVPSRKIGKATISKLRDYSMGNRVSLFDACRDANLARGDGVTANRVKAFVELMDSIVEYAKTHTVSELLTHIISEVGYMEFLDKEYGYEADERKANVSVLVDKSVSYADDAQAIKWGIDGVAKFLEVVALFSDVEEKGKDVDCVKMMTIHKAKGLEFPNVYLVGLEEDIFPSKKSIETPSGIEEERRLFYVGITRAMETLTVTSARNRMIYGKWIRCMTSRFVREIPQDLIE